jgi:DNA gyrase subunit B
MPEGRYSASDITVLEGLEAIRVRPHLYVGDTGSSEAITNLVLEVLCLAVDVKTGGPARNVEIRLLSDDIAEVWNDGPGLPLGRHSRDDVSLIEVIMTRLHACRDEKADERSAKWCTVGIAAVNALSEWCVVTVRREGGVWHQRFARGKALHDLERIEDCADTGTTVRFNLDRLLLKGRFDTQALEAALARFAADVPCTAVSLRDLRERSNGSVRH